MTIAILYFTLLIIYPYYTRTHIHTIIHISIAIVVNDRLWGLYSLHSYDKPVKPSVEQRIMLEMV